MVKGLRPLLLVPVATGISSCSIEGPDLGPPVPASGSRATALAPSTGGNVRSPVKVPRLYPEAEEDEGKAFVEAKMKEIIIPIIDFEDTSVEEAWDFIRLRSYELDPDPDPTKRGISFHFKKPKPDAAERAALEEAAEGGLLPAKDPDALRIRKLHLKNVSMWDVLHRIADETGLKVEITDYGIELSPKEKPPKRSTRQELEAAIIPVIDFEDTSLEEAIDFVRLRSRQLDPEDEPKGVSILIRKPRPTPEEMAEGAARHRALWAAVPDPSVRIKELRMRNVSAWRVLQRVAAETGLKVMIDGDDYLRLVPK